MYDVYSTVLPLYFPRTAEEHTIAGHLLPTDLGDENGQPRIQARAMYDSILHVPVAERTASTPLDQSFREDMDSWLSQGGFDEFKTQGESIDQHRAAVGRCGDVNQEREREIGYARLLQRADQDLAPIARTGWLYKCGVAREGSTIITINAAALLELKPTHDQILLHFVSVMDGITHGRFMIVYIHTDIPNQYRPDRSWLSRVHQDLVHRYHKNVKAIFVFNASIWLRTAFAFVVPPTKKLWRNKLYFMDTLDELNHFVEDSQLAIDPQLIKSPGAAASFFKKFF
eukprot:TRINITY_DN27552_c0_g1_i3.p1 TRINITY_DN27552_c0_g1~~TRINITY_DN27552_c0_g1_i3.p1  ORF type:complete len:285 (+),score=54.46 TRINITY_DN27552_c0_g1_i3:879-1733(+)